MPTRSRLPPRRVLLEVIDDEVLAPDADEARALRAGELFPEGGAANKTHAAQAAARALGKTRLWPARAPPYLPPLPRSFLPSMTAERSTSASNGPFWYLVSRVSERGGPSRPSASSSLALTR